MSDHFKYLDSKQMGLIKSIAKEAETLNLNAFLVGGVVRDLILRRPILDLDVVIEKDAITLAQSLSKKLHGQLRVYPEFKTATIDLPHDGRLDLATTRQETYAHPGALPTVACCDSIQDDLSRRDFSINAMALSINLRSWGKMIDPCDGFKDIKAKKIKVLHSKSFQDDPTRLLRAVRFAERFGFAIESKTLVWFKEAVKQQQILNVNPARYCAELRKIFLEEDPVSSLKTLNNLKALAEILWGDRSQAEEILRRSINHMKSVYESWDRLYKKDGFYHSLNQRVLFGFLILFDSIPLQYREKMIKRFPFKREEIDAFYELPKVTELILKLREKTLLPSEVYQILRSVDLFVVLFLRCYIKEKYMQQRIDRFLKNDRQQRLELTGEDLKKIGIPQGQAIGEILDQILYAKIDGHVRSKKDQMRLAQSLA